MQTYTIKTRVIFENVYVIEADSAEEAINTIMEDEPEDVLQKYIGEDVISTMLGDKEDYYRGLGFV